MQILLLADKLETETPFGTARESLTRLATGFDASRLHIVTAAFRAPTGGGVEISLAARRQADPSAIRALRRLCRELDIELIHALEPGAGIAAATVGRLLEIPVIVTCPTFPMRMHVSRARWLQLRWFWRLLGGAGAHVLTQTELVKRNLLYAANFPPDQIVVVYPPCDVPETIPDREALGLPGGPFVVMAMPPHPDPGPERAVEMLQRLLKRQPEVTLGVLGSGEALEPLYRRASEVRPALPIRWLGAREDWLNVIGAADVVIDLQMAEGVPLALLPALLMGKPVVAARQSGASEIIETNVNGLLVSPEDTSDMALQIGRLLQYESVAGRVGRMAKRRAEENFSAAAYTRAMTELYESTIYTTR